MSAILVAAILVAATQVAAIQVVFRDPIDLTQIVRTVDGDGDLVAVAVAVAVAVEAAEVEVEAVADGEMKAASRAEALPAAMAEVVDGEAGIAVCRVATAVKSSLPSK